MVDGSAFPEWSKRACSLVFQPIHQYAKPEMVNSRSTELDCLSCLSDKIMCSCLYPASHQTQMLFRLYFDLWVSASFHASVLEAFQNLSPLWLSPWYPDARLICSCGKDFTLSFPFCLSCLCMEKILSVFCVLEFCPRMFLPPLNSFFADLYWDSACELFQNHIRELANIIQQVGQAWRAKIWAAV